MSELLLLLGQCARVQLLSEQSQLHAVCSVVVSYCEAIREGAHALRLVADDRDAFAYYRIGEELDLDWDFSDPQKTCDLAHWLDHIARAVRSRPRPLFSGAALHCANKALAEQARADKDLEQSVLWVRGVWGLLQRQSASLHSCADLLEAAGAVVDYQLRFGVSMEVAAAGGDGSALQSLASRLGELADAVINVSAPRAP